ncbi:MAG: cation:proton antiporter [Anaerolineae bacterium]|nr:cation:proton antiporter [Anaerolineae bacterium]
MGNGLLILSLVLVLAGVTGVLLGKWSITMPIIFVAAGAILSATGVLTFSPNNEAVRTLTEATLVLLLFADASTLNAKKVREDASLPGRLLGIGLPLTIALGALIAWLFFPADGLGFALLIATILAPTDAALGLPIFVNRSVPVRIRRALNVESGLNDGLATPFITLFIALAVSQEAASQGGWLLSALLQILLAAGAGIAVGAIGGKLLVWARARDWTEGAPLQFAVLGLAFAAYLGSIAVGGNGFVAAFVGGISFRWASRGKLTEAAEYTETTGTLLSLFVWVIFGAVFVTPFVFQQFDLKIIVYAVLSLTIIRMIPVYLALRGTGLRSDTRLIMGWFGPRGLASVIFSLMAIEALEGAGKETHLLASIAAWTILLSVLAHGLSAKPLAAWFARRLPAEADIPERKTLSEIHHRAALGITAKQAAEAPDHS